MTTIEIIIALTIYLILPLTGLIFSATKETDEKRKHIKCTDNRIIFGSTYGGLLLVALTTLFWQWSGMASLGTFYLILGAPVAMGIIAYRHRKTKKDTKYHKWTYLSGILYFAIAPVMFLILYFVVEYLELNGL